MSDRATIAIPARLESSRLPRKVLADISGKPMIQLVYEAGKRAGAGPVVVLTDSETWAGKIHPVQALREYRAKTGIPAKLVVVGLVSNGFSIADPSDAGMLDVVGFDTAAPAVIADFIRA